MRRGLLLLCACACAAACAPAAEPSRRSAIEHGRGLFSSPAASDATNNGASCATCHLADQVDPRVLPGHPLAGAVQRPTFWGGQYSELLRSINDCRHYFMGASTPWTREDEQGKAMFAYLSSLPSTRPDALPLTIVRYAADLPAGDAARGRRVYDASCRACHGAAKSGDGALRRGSPVLPDQVVDELRARFGFGDQEIRVAFIEKVRHGPFLGLSGRMPPYAEETLSDADLAAILGYLGL